MKSFWITIFNVVWASILGGIISAINDGTRMEGIMLAFMFVLWFEIRDNAQQNND